MQSNDLNEDLENLRQEYDKKFVFLKRQMLFLLVMSLMCWFRDLTQYLQS